jgi:hypothetical protein
MKYIGAAAFLVSLAALGVLGGCTTDPDKGDAGAAEREECTLRVQACMNKCNEADLGMSCKLWCRRNGLSCDADGGYSFYSCLDE